MGFLFLLYDQYETVNAWEGEWQNSCLSSADTVGDHLATMAAVYGEYMLDKEQINKEIILHTQDLFHEIYSSNKFSENQDQEISK